MKEPRAAKTIQDEYAKLCCQIGDITWRIKKLTRDLERLHTDANRLDQEYLEATKVPQEPTELENPQETKAP